jgi:drug/metabolite transporter (DMT)-like permease
MTLTATRTDYFKLHFIVLLWGFTAIGAKLISIPAVEMVFYRTLLAAIGMGMVILFNKGVFTVSTGDFVKIFFTGFIVGIHWLTFFRSGQVSNPSTSLVGFATCSLWAALLEPIANRKKIDILEIGLGLVVVGGLALIFSFNFQYKTGLILGIISGLTAAMFSVINAKIAVRVSAHTITFYEMIGAFISVCLFLPYYQQHFTEDGQLHLTPVGTDWLYIAILAWACSVYAYSVAINLTKKMSVFFIQLTLNLEPVYGIIMAIIIFGQQEIMGWNFYAGTLVILSAVVIYPYLKKKKEAYSSRHEIT